VREFEGIDEGVRVGDLMESLCFANKCTGPPAEFEFQVRSMHLPCVGAT
jgi:hypothetical protein